jgi:hypothetical protein
MVIEDDELLAAGVTDSQVPPLGVVVALVANDTTPPGSTGDIENEICCEMGVVEPAATAGGVQDAGLGVTTGGRVPMAMMVASVRLNTLGGPPLRVYVTVPATRLVSGMFDGTAVLMYPVGIVALAETRADWIKQLLTAIVSGAPRLSVSVTVTGEEGSQVALPSVTPVTAA